MKKIKVSYMPADSDIEDKVFTNKKDALNYIEQYLCKDCKEDLKRGYWKVEGIKIPVNNALDTMCGADWMIEEVDDDI